MEKLFNIINEEETVLLYEELARQGHEKDAALIIVSNMVQKLQQIIDAHSLSASSVYHSVLSQFAQLKPTREQVRRALTRLLQVPAQKGTRQYQFFSPRQWLCVYKALQFINIMNDRYGCMAQMEAYILDIFQGFEAPRISCVQDSLTKKNIGRPFNGTLQQWEEHRDSHDMANYWPLALLFLQYLAEECVTEGVTPPAITEVVTELSKLCPE